METVIEKNDNRRYTPLSRRITDRDFILLRWIGEQYSIDLEHLRILVGMNTSRKTKRANKVTKVAVHKLVQRWQELGLVSYQKFEYGADKAGWVWLTNTGLQLVGLDYRYNEPNFTLLEHRRQVNQVRLWFEKQAIEEDQELEWTSEREWLYMLGGKVGHIPDAVIVWKGKKLALEIELSRKRTERIKEIITGILAIDKIDGGVYFVNSATENLIKEAIKGYKSISYRRLEGVEV